MRMRYSAIVCSSLRRPRGWRRSHMTTNSRGPNRHLQDDSSPSPHHGAPDGGFVRNCSPRDSTENLAISLPCPRISLPYFVALPEEPGPWPGVVVIHEGGGISPQLLRVCQRLAAEGYGAIAPDFFFRSGGTRGGRLRDADGRTRTRTSSWPMCPPPPIRCGASAPIGSA